MLKLYFNPRALETLAKELRRGSWGVAVAAAAGGISGTEWTPPWLIIGSTVVWVVLQCAAVALESLKDEKDEK